jgi:hypothetical protein
VSQPASSGLNTSIPQHNRNAEHDVLGGCDDFAHGGPFAPLLLQDRPIGRIELARLLAAI